MVLNFKLFSCFKALKFRYLSLYLWLLFRNTDINERLSGFNQVFNLFSV
jgi:hypothetical protein